MTMHDPSFLQKNNLYAIPIVHYNMEMAAQVKMAFDALQPDCVAVELPETMQQKMLHASSRLPDISVVLTYNHDHSPLYFMCEPCDPAFEGLRSASERGVEAFCIDLDVDCYPIVREVVPDPYSIQHLGLKVYYDLYREAVAKSSRPSASIDQKREMYMARRLKELCLRYDRVLFIGGMAHTASIFKFIDRQTFPEFLHADREAVEICTLTAESCRDALAEWGYLSFHYEEQRAQMARKGSPDRQDILFRLYCEAAENYVKNTGNAFPGYHLHNIMKFVRNYALTGGQLTPSLFKILTAAKGCVDHHYAYEVWELATAYPYHRNVDGLPELDLSIEDLWGSSKLIRFYLKQKGRKNSVFPQLKKDRSLFRLTPPNPFTICSYPPEDIAIENFGKFLKKKGSEILMEERSRTLPFSTSIEDGVDVRETIRHWHEKKLYVKARGKPPEGVGSVCIIFDEDKPEEGKLYKEKYPWRTTWIGEHQQESDMAFYATSLAEQMVGPGISRCQYGGFMMSYPPRRLIDVWHDPDYAACRTKAELLLMAAIDYAVKPVVVYVAGSPPRSLIKNFAGHFGKKVVYIPIGQLSPITLNKLRAFHVLDGHDRRKIADEYIY